MSYIFEPSQPLPPAPRWLTVGSAIAWILIVASVAAIIVRPRWMVRGGGAERAALPSIERTRSTQLEMVSRLAMGARAFSPDGKGDPSMVGQIDATAKNAIDEFRGIIMIDELSGDEAALARLNEFERKNKVVRLREDVDALRILYKRGLDHLTARQTQMLLDRHGWFGKVAVSHGLPPTDARRQAALRPAGRAMLVGMGAAFVGLALLVTGVVLAILGIVFFVQGRLVRAYQPAPPGLAGPLVEAFALYLAGMVGVSLLLARLFPEAGLGASFGLFGLLPLLLVYLRVRGVEWSEIRRDLGWHRGRGFWREAGAGLIGYIAGLPVLALGFVATFFLMKPSGNSSSHPIVNEPIEGAMDVLELLLLASVGAPIIEETMFRGALFGHLRAKFGWWISAPIVSLVFAAIHPQGWVAIPVLGAIAMVLAGLREWRGSLVAPMTAHAFNNGVAVLMLVLMTG